MFIGHWDGLDVKTTVAMEPLGGGRFRSVVGQPNTIGHLFGGQFMGLALQAAALTVEDKQAHAAHGFFLRPGNVDLPVEADVELLFDGRSFATRSVRLGQGGDTIFTLQASFQRPDSGVEHASAPLAASPAPDDLESVQALIENLDAGAFASLRHRMRTPAGIDLRPTAGAAWFQAAGGFQRSAWMRLPSAFGASDAMNRSLLAYAADYVLASTAATPHEAHAAAPFRVASLNQATWFYRPFRVSEWLYVQCDSPSAQGGRGLGRADFFDQDGVLLASAAQEVMIRRREAL
jgi:acyl-CoA thioesterase-2